MTFYLCRPCYKDLQAFFDEAADNGSSTTLDDFIAEFEKCALQNQPDELPDNGSSASGAQ